MLTSVADFWKNKEKSTIKCWFISVISMNTLICLCQFEGKSINFNNLARWHIYFPPNCFTNAIDVYITLTSPPNLDDVFSDVLFVYSLLILFGFVFIRKCDIQFANFTIQLKLFKWLTFFDWIQMTKHDVI